LATYKCLRRLKRDHHGLNARIVTTISQNMTRAERKAAADFVLGVGVWKYTNFSCFSFGRWRFGAKKDEAHGSGEWDE
jgi:hypothetical protein